MTIFSIGTYASAGTGVCAHPDSQWEYRIVGFGRELKRTRSIDVPGLPIMVQGSPSGRLAAWTTSLGGHGNSLSHGMSTRTSILDTRDGAGIASLDGSKDGKPYVADGRNFWGVTFAADDNRFCATMAANSTVYLVEGDLAARTIKVLAQDAGSPSLLPDGTRVVVTRALHGGAARGSGLSIVDLATTRMTALAEDRTVEDQVVWVDAATVANTLAVQRVGGDHDTA